MPENGLIAGYAIERQLGRGGMGTVYLARHPRLPRSVALKLLDEQMFGDEEARARFAREADLAARLDHPNIVGVFDRGVEGRRPWIAMQYVHGTDAAAVGVFEPFRAMRVVSEVAAALDFAHSHGVLHRDIKPANILLGAPLPGQPERVVLADFGIARLHIDKNPLTQTGSFTATLAYAAPEQLAALPLDPRCDQYSLACTFFALLTGRSPFEATNPVAVIQAHMSAATPSIVGVRPELPSQLDAVLARATAKRPADRFDSCGEFASAVSQAFLAEPGPVAAPRQAVPSVVTTVADRRTVDRGPVRPPVVKGAPGWAALTARRQVDEVEPVPTVPARRPVRLQPRQLLILFYVSLLVILCILVFTDVTNW
ncbi:serine/threonine-protein kinase [Nocardia rosealba]|uniref:serine/threonine-protein kinase n=1 Tax=Nocardia rosealba TaxID=2878563 RepID=UPI0027DF5BDB|nr:serine/threonine-protein kinase [Nocardia rosealba]